MPDKDKNIFDRIWDFFATVKLAIVILIILAATSIIGTIVPQESEKAIQFLARIFGDNTAPTVYNLFLKLDFMDMYHSWWFMTLLILFSINLTVCSLEKFPKTWRLIKTPMRPLQEHVIKSLPIKKEITIKTNLNVAKDEVLNSLTSAKYRAFEATEEDSLQLYSQKGRYTRLGVYIVHLSILLVFVGAIIGARFGFDGFANIPEGGAVNAVYTNSGERIPLGFTIKCNWYKTDYYTGSDTPREYSSELVVFDGDKKPFKKVIEVNNPLTYKGITFYQSSYGMIPDAVGEFILKVTSEKGQEKTLRLELGDSFEISDKGIKGTIVDFSPALGRDPQTGKLITYTENMVNPAVSIRFKIKGEGNDAEDEFTGWVLQRYPETGILQGGHKIELVDYWGVEYTGLQVSKDPGVEIIYFAFTIMTLGLYIALFMSHRKIWIRLTPDTSGGKNSVRITIGGSASKNRLALEKELEKILSKISQAIKGRNKK